MLHPGNTNVSEQLFAQQIRKELSRREFLTCAAGLIVGLPALTDDLTSLLEDSADHLSPTRGETRPGAPSFRSRRKRPRELPLREGQLFLTFDDGPLPCTGRILDQLAATGHKATFFVTGRNLANAALREFAIRAVKEGHEIGNHSFHHPDFSRISTTRAKQEIVSTYALIQEVIKETGLDATRQNRFFRFPYGVAGSRSNFFASQEVLASLNYKIAWWDLDTNDWRMELPWFARRASSVVESLRRARPGDVVLLHDRVKTSECLPAMFSALESHKLSSLPLSSYEMVVGTFKEKGGADMELHSSKSPYKQNVAELAEELSSALFSHGDSADVWREAVTSPRFSKSSNLW